MFKKILHRDIDDRLQARLDMIAGLFDEPAEGAEDAFAADDPLAEQEDLVLTAKHAAPASATASAPVAEAAAEVAEPAVAAAEDAAEEPLPLRDPVAVAEAPAAKAPVAEIPAEVQAAPPAATKSAAATPAAATPVAKRVEAKAAAPEPVATRPADTKHAESRPADAEPVEAPVKRSRRDMGDVDVAAKLERDMGEAPARAGMGLLSRLRNRGARDVEEGRADVATNRKPALRSVPPVPPDLDAPAPVAAAPVAPAPVAPAAAEAPLALSRRDPAAEAMAAAAVVRMKPVEKPAQEVAENVPEQPAADAPVRTVAEMPSEPVSVLRLQRGEQASGEHAAEANPFRQDEPLARPAAKLSLKRAAPSSNSQAVQRFAAKAKARALARAARARVDGVAARPDPMLMPQQPAAERTEMDRPAMDRPAMDRPAAERNFADMAEAAREIIAPVNHQPVGRTAPSRGLVQPEEPTHELPAVDVMEFIAASAGPDAGSEKPTEIAPESVAEEPVVEEPVAEPVIEEVAAEEAIEDEIVEAPKPVAEDVAEIEDAAEVVAEIEDAAPEAELADLDEPAPLAAEFEAPVELVAETVAEPVVEEPVAEEPVAAEAAPEPQPEPQKPAAQEQPGVRSGGTLNIEGLDGIIGETFASGVGFTPVVAVVTGPDRFVLRTARLRTMLGEENAPQLAVAWFHSAPTPLPIPVENGTERPDLAAQMLGLVLSALRDDRFTGDIVDYAGLEPGTDDATLASEVLERVFSAADDLVSRGLEPDLTDDGQLPTPTPLMRAAFVEWSGGPRKSETYAQAFARLTAARVPGRLAVAPPAGREKDTGGGQVRQIGFAS